MARSYIDRFIYSITKKPKHYKDVHNPPETSRDKLLRPQDARQVQYNKWSKSHQIYSGSYLPYRYNDLSKQGWKKIIKSNNKYETEHIRKSTGQHVLRHGRHVNKFGKIEPTHYHWINENAKKYSKKGVFLITTMIYLEMFVLAEVNNRTSNHIGEGEAKDE